MTTDTDGGVPCFCGKTFKNQFYLGKHVAQTDDPQHNPPKPDISDSIEKQYSSSGGSSPDKKTDSSGGGENSPPSSSPVTQLQPADTSGEIQGEWRELDNSDPYEAELADKGYSEINMTTEEVR